MTSTSPWACGAVAAWRDHDVAPGRSRLAATTGELVPGRPLLCDQGRLQTQRQRHLLEAAGVDARALQAHVRGFILKDAPAATLSDGIRRIANGERVIAPELVAAALEAGTSPLTARETDVLRAAENGGSTEDIARHLSLSPATVRNYLSNAIGKVGGRNRMDAIRIARDAGWL